MTTPLVPSITDEQIAEIERKAQHKLGEGFYCVHNIAAADIIALISRLRAAESKIQLWHPIMDEVDRRAGKECCLEDRCDFTVTVSYEDYAAMQEHNQ